VSRIARVIDAGIHHIAASARAQRPSSISVQAHQVVQPGFSGRDSGCEASICLIMLQRTLHLTWALAEFRSIQIETDAVT
jgi:hypothetical protein